MAEIDPYDREGLAGVFGIPPTLACEIMYMNDEGKWRATPEERFAYMKKWIEENLLPVEAPDVSPSTEGA
jgi:hypothetical protein